MRVSRLSRFPLLVLAGIAAVSARADSIKILDSHTQTFQNTGCAASKTCDLKSFTLEVQNEAVDVSSEGAQGLTYLTKMYAIQKTDTLAHLYDYGIVQFIRGCQYSSVMSNGKLEQYLNLEENIDGRNVTYQFPSWMIDGFVPDPLDWNDKEDPKTRFSAYQWSPSGNFRGSDAKYVGNATPTNPMLFVSDIPGPAGLDSASGIATNISLQFKTCVYRTSDVPTSVPPTDVDFSQPVQCLDWSSSWVYDFASRTYTRPTEIQPICLDPSLAPFPYNPPVPTPLPNTPK